MEGEAPQILREGDAFYEPVGARILRFDNASATEEAIFIDFNLEQVDEPFIVFEEFPAEAIDRRTLPTIYIEDRTVDQKDIYVSEISNGGPLDMSNQTEALGLGSEGGIELQIEGEENQRYKSGENFALPGANAQATIINASSEVRAEIITFLMR